MGRDMAAHVYRRFAVVAVVFALGCHEGVPLNPISSTPPPTTVSAPTGRVTVSGTVWIHDGGGVRPDANGRMFGWVQEPTQGRTTGQVPTDGSGRFSFPVPHGAQVRLQSSINNAYQPCQVTVRADSDVMQDIHAVVDHQQLGAQLPAEFLAHTPLLSGVVFEQTDDGRRPLSDVRVELDGLGGMGLVAATTLTDANGRYILCGLGDERSTYLFASKTGYRLFESGVTLGGNTNLDIEMRK
jgi:hypothetical protein